MAVNKKLLPKSKNSSMRSSNINNPMVVPSYMVTLSVLVPKDCYAKCLLSVSEVLLNSDKDYLSKKKTRNSNLVLSTDSVESSIGTQGQIVNEAIGLPLASEVSLPSKTKKKNKRPKKRSRKSKQKPDVKTSSKFPTSIVDTPSNEFKEVMEMVKGYKYCATLTKNASIRNGLAGKIDALLKTLSSSESEPESIKTLDFEKTMFVETAVTSAVKNRGKSKIPLGTQIQVEGVSVDTNPMVSLVKPGLPVHTNDRLAIGNIHPDSDYSSQRSSRSVSFTAPLKVNELTLPDVNSFMPDYEDHLSDDDGFSWGK